MFMCRRGAANGFQLLVRVLSDHTGSVGCKVREISLNALGMPDLDTII